MMKIGFSAESFEKELENAKQSFTPTPASPVKSIVQVRFPGRGTALSYYNDRFDLHRGDLVFVDGKLEGQRGRVVDVAYNFKIKLSDYKRVIAVADTHVQGEFHMAGSHFVAFDRITIPYEKILGWFKAPVKEEDEFVSGNDSSSFRLDDLKSMGVSGPIAERGHDYYMENKVVYLSIDGTHGHAIVEGSEPYELEFEYYKGEISHLTCTCFCSYPCKHEFAAMLQLRETLDLIEKNYKRELERSEYFAAISKMVLFNFAVDGNENGSFRLDT